MHLLAWLTYQIKESKSHCLHIHKTLWQGNRIIFKMIIKYKISWVYDTEGKSDKEITIGYPKRHRSRDWKDDKETTITIAKWKSTLK